MTSADVISVCQTAPQADVIAVHMETINHCGLTRAQLASEVAAAGLSGRVTIPHDGDTLARSDCYAGGALLQVQRAYFLPTQICHTHAVIVGVGDMETMIQPGPALRPMQLRGIKRTILPAGSARADQRRHSWRLLHIDPIPRLRKARCIHRTSKQSHTTSRGVRSAEPYHDNPTTLQTVPPLTPPLLRGVGIASQIWASVMQGSLALKLRVKRGSDGLDGCFQRNPRQPGRSARPAFYLNSIQLGSGQSPCAEFRWCLHKFR